ncbi:MAG: PrsW family glutamic-type intramembrane protease [Prosthecobacter sp.]|nr:PrsW family glutamic-type intramembrane protease [Prosthecobacter sp.]
MFFGWRARLHYWSRQTDALKKAALGIVATGFGSAWLFLMTVPETRPAPVPDPVEQGLRNAWQRLHRATSADPRELGQWLRDLLPHADHLCDAAGVDYPTWETFQKAGRVAAYDVRGLVQQHAGGAEAARMFEDFVQVYLAKNDSSARDAIKRLQERAWQPTPPPMANELHAAVLIRAQDQGGALAAFVREARLFDDALVAREDALRLALEMKDTETLRELVSMPGGLAAMAPRLQYQAGEQLQDPWLMGTGLLRHRLTSLHFKVALLAGFAAALWYAILVLQSAPRRWRWLLPVAPLLAGMGSVWPALWMGAWQETTLQMQEDAPFPHDLWYFVMGVGLREELAKLAVFALFLPWLLWRRAPGLALMTGAFVGLGFALDENIGYYERFGGGVALVRFLSANFLHAALSGMAAHALYDLLRSRFARADKFIATFLTVVAVHGLYDYAAGKEAPGMNYLLMIVLAFTAWQFLDLLEHEAPGARQLVSPAAVFLIGVAILIAMVFWLSAMETGSLHGLYAAAADCVTILPLGFIYWRRLDHA